MQQSVIISGAGPVGLITALRLAKEGITVTVLEAGKTICQDFRAPAFHSTSIDIFDALGVLEPIAEIGLKIPTMIFSDRTLNRTVELPFDILQERGYTNHPYDLCIGQQALAQVLYDALASYDNCEVLFQHEVSTVTQNSDSVSIVCNTPNGEKSFSTPWLVGADGARSGVRKSLDIPYEGFTWEDRFLLIHTRVDLTEEVGIVNFMADGPDWRLVLKIPFGAGENEWVTRCVSSVLPEMSDEEAQKPQRLQSIMQDLSPRDKPYDILESVIYAVNQRVASKFREGRVMLVGDAAHLNSPLGGMGLNSGIHDGMNMADKLSQVIKDNAGDELLDLFALQRRQTTINFIQKNSIENKESQQETDIAKREGKINFLASLADNDEGRLQFMKRWMMYDAQEFAESVSL